LEKQTVLFLGQTSVGTKLQGHTDTREGLHAMPQSSDTVSDWTHRSVSAEPQSSANPPATDCTEAPVKAVGVKTGQKAAATKRYPELLTGPRAGYRMVWVGRDL